MPAPRIAISGVGLVSALGQSAPETFAALMRGESGIAPITLFEPGDVRSRLVGAVRALAPSDSAWSRDPATLSRTDAMAVAAALEARAAARLPAGARLGVVLGGTTGGMFETEGLLSGPELPRLTPERARELVAYPLSSSLKRVTEAVGGARVTRSICSACSGGAIALVQAAAWLSRGDADFVLAGGADGLCRLTLLGFNALGATDPERCRPFDKSRAGLNLGEGAAVLVLEREETAVARGAPVLAWLDGYAVGAEAHHITHPEPSGARAAQLLREALARAALAPAEVGYVNAHGTGTQQNDAMEARALLEVFGAAQPWVSSSKAQLGHTLGAAGALEAALTVLALARAQVPPGVGLSEPELPGLRHVGAVGRSEALVSAVSSSFGFGGMSCVLAFSHPSRPAPAVTARASSVVVTRSTVLRPGEAAPALEPDRSRRFDAGSTLAASGAASLANAGGRIGFVLGTAFGNVERTMAFLARGRERGARHVPPAEFPHLVPSAPAGNASVYASLTGPVFAVGDLARSGEAAFEAARDLLELGVADQIIAGAISPRDAIVERVLAPLFEQAGVKADRRGEGAGFLLLTRLEPGAPGAVVAEVLAHHRAELGPGYRLPSVPAADVRLALVLGAAGSELRELLDASPWHAAPRVDLAAEHGFHEALGAVALATGAGLVCSGQYGRVLVVSGSAGEVTATLFGAVDAGG